jgi:hypothetical protein
MFEFENGKREGVFPVRNGTRREGYCEAQSGGNLNDVLQMSILGHKYRFLTAAV